MRVRDKYEGLSEYQVYGVRKEYSIYMPKTKPRSYYTEFLLYLEGEWQWVDADDFKPISD